MDGDRTEKALFRIEAALARLETAAARSVGGSGELEARHKQLRSAVTQALSQLDALLAGHKS